MTDAFKNSIKDAEDISIINRPKSIRKEIKCFKFFCSGKALRSRYRLGILWWVWAAGRNRLFHRCVPLSRTENVPVYQELLGLLHSQRSFRDSVSRMFLLWFIEAFWTRHFGKDYRIFRKIKGSHLLSLLYCRSLYEYSLFCKKNSYERLPMPCQLRPCTHKGNAWLWFFQLWHGLVKSYHQESNLILEHLFGPNCLQFLLVLQDDRLHRLWFFRSNNIDELKPWIYS